MSGTRGPSSEFHILHTASSGVPPLCALPSLDLGSARVTPPSYSAVFFPLCFANVRTWARRNRSRLQLAQRISVIRRRKGHDPASGRGSLLLLSFL